MQILVSGRWQSGFLDACCGTDEVRLRVLAIRNVEPVRGMHYERPRSWRLLYNYAREVGLIGLIRRVRSRLAESARNEKFLSCGWGIVIEAGAACSFAPGDKVVFLAPSHPAAAERLVVSQQFVEAADELDFPSPDWRTIRWISIAQPRSTTTKAIAGFMPQSGSEIDPAALAAAKAAVRTLAVESDWLQARLLPIDETPVLISTSTATVDGGTLLFGLGNYAKTVIVPSVSPFLKIDRIHEIDPTQIGSGDLTRTLPAFSTHPSLLANDRPDAVFVAGYHHTHAQLAITALGRGAYAVVEKPLVTRRSDLAHLLEAVATRQKLFACFHKRYSPFNEVALRDLGHAPGQPIDYHAIVYETPLPPLHWYRWPNSRTRLTSNGCHWLDHFLMFNDFAAVVRRDVVSSASEIISVFVELENGASFTMALTDHGSERVGLRDHIELRLGDRTVTIDDNSRYRSESSSRVIRQQRRNRSDSYGRMYSTIARTIRAGGPGDSLRSIEASATLTLDLEDLVTQPARSG